MLSDKNILLSGSHGKPVTTDICYLPSAERKPVVIYTHGFNGFKDWANFDLIARQFAEAGFVFIKFNFSHNGTSPDQPEEFVDLEAYGLNNYSIELDDLQTVIDWSLSPHIYAKEIDPERVFVIGHSRGGGIVLLKAAEEPRIRAVATWASVAECKTPWGNWDSAKMKSWIDTGVQHVTNSRTGQQLPLYYQLFEDYQFHKERLDIRRAVEGMRQPLLICHGLQDPSVPVEKAYHLHEWKPDSELFLVESDHVFGRKHPWESELLPDPMQAVVDKTVEFFRRAGENYL